MKLPDKDKIAEYFFNTCLVLLLIAGFCAAYAPIYLMDTKKISPYSLQQVFKKAERYEEIDAYLKLALEDGKVSRYEGNKIDELYDDCRRSEIKEYYANKGKENEEVHFN